MFIVFSSEASLDGLMMALDKVLDHDATIPNGTVTIGRTSLVGVGHSGSNPIVPLMLHMVYFRTITRALTLYYRFLGTASTLLRSRDGFGGAPGMALAYPQILKIYIYLKAFGYAHKIKMPIWSLPIQFSVFVSAEKG